VKEKLTTEQHWKMVAMQATLQEAQRAMELAQEVAGHLHTRLGIAQRASDKATQKRDEIKTVFKTEFIRLGHDFQDGIHPARARPGRYWEPGYMEDPP